MKPPLSIFRNWMYRIRCHDFGNGNIIDEGVKIIHPEYVSIGSNVVIHKDTIIHVAAKEKVRDKPIVKIGDRVHLSFRTWIAARAGITIEEDVGFAPNVTLQDYIHGYEDINIPIKSQTLTGEAPIHIGKGCILGANVIVLPGVTIGEQCMIGGNAVVASDIPAYSVAVGNPAKVVRKFDRHRGEWVRV